MKNKKITRHQQAGGFAQLPIHPSFEEARRCHCAAAVAGAVVLAVLVVHARVGVLGYLDDSVAYQ